MESDECVDDYAFWFDKSEYKKSKSGYFVRLKLLNQVDTPLLSLDCLKMHGLKAPPESPIRVIKELDAYISKHFDDDYSKGLFVDVDSERDYHEGHVRSVQVNVYERSSIARRKCIELRGINCFICGMNFEETYGEVGREFIHVHHLRPLYAIGSDYIVDYKNDLIPVCPNCHAMIHRLPGGEEMTVEELKMRLNKETPSVGGEEQEREIFTSTKTKEVEDKHVDMKMHGFEGVKVGAPVVHKRFGTGIVTTIDLYQKHIGVMFQTGEKVFAFPRAFEERFLVLIQ